MYACFYGHTDIGRMLLDHGAVIDHCEKVKDLEHVATHYYYDLLHIGVWKLCSYASKCFWLY